MSCNRWFINPLILYPEQISSQLCWRTGSNHYHHEPHVTFKIITHFFCTQGEKISFQT